MRSHNSPVTGKSQSDGLVEAVHRVGGKHPRTASAPRTRTSFYLLHIGIAYRWVSRLDHRVNQVEMLSPPFARLHRPSRHKHRRDIQAHGGHQHSRSNLVAVRDTDHRIGLVRVHHIFHAVGYQVARRKRIQHSVMSHGDAVINGNRVELCGEASQLLYLGLHLLAGFVQMRVPRHELGERIDYGYDGFAHHFFFHPVGRPQGACPGHTAAFGTHRTA